jgi:hypothetical protein
VTTDLTTATADAKTEAVARAPQASHGEKLTSCRNCGFSFSQVAGEVTYCPQCGQDTHPHSPGALEFIHEFATHYVALEGKLWKSLLLLFFLPGELSKKFTAGQKVRYVAPLRLYITASFLFFVVVKMAGWGSLVNVDSTSKTTSDKPAVEETSGERERAGAEQKSDASSIEAREKADTDSKDVDEPVRKSFEYKSEGAPGYIPKEVLSGPAVGSWNCDADSALCKKMQTHLNEKWQGKTVQDVINTMKTGVVGNMPYAIFFMLPFFSLMTYLLYWRRDLRFGDHMVYAMHVHTMTFFGLLGKSLLPQVIGDILLGLLLIYYWVALQRYFGGRWWMTAMRYMFIGTFYPVLVSIMTALVITLVVIV